jgi:hypothetical protein
LAKKTEIILPALLSLIFVVIAVLVAFIAVHADSITLGVFGLSIGLLAVVVSVLSLRA